MSRCRPQRLQPANMCELESSRVFNCPRAGPAHSEKEPFVGRGLSAPPESVKNSWSEERAENQEDGAPDCSYTSCWSCDDPIFIAAPPGLETRASFARSRRLGATRSAHHFATLCRCRVRKVFASHHGLNELGHLCIQCLRTCFASGSLVPGQAGALISGVTRYVCFWRNLVVLIWKISKLYSASCGVCIEVGPSPSQPNSEHQHLTRPYIMWQYPPPAEARQIRWCDVKKKN